MTPGTVKLNGSISHPAFSIKGTRKPPRQLSTCTGILYFRPSCKHQRQVSVSQTMDYTSISLPDICLNKYQSLRQLSTCTGYCTSRLTVNIKDRYQSSRQWTIKVSVSQTSVNMYRDIVLQA